MCDLEISPDLTAGKPFSNRDIDLAAFNPLSGIFTLYRVGFFPEVWDTLSVDVGAAMSIGFLVVGIVVFRRLERPVLKEL